MASVLIVDDSSFMRDTLRYIIEGAGHEVIGEAVNTESAVSLYKELSPQVVTLDYLMEGENGLQALKAIRAHDPEARVIMISAVDFEEVKDLSLQNGACSFINKPPVRGHLLSEIERVVGE
jgi:two-component system chemotaxis response regulator CheY